MSIFQLARNELTNLYLDPYFWSKVNLNLNKLLGDVLVNISNKSNKLLYWRTLSHNNYPIKCWSLINNL